jgi:hypothetical protein
VHLEGEEAIQKLAAHGAASHHEDVAVGNKVSHPLRVNRGWVERGEACATLTCGGVEGQNYCAAAGPTECREAIRLKPVPRAQDARFVRVLLLELLHAQVQYVLAQSSCCVPQRRPRNKRTHPHNHMDTKHKASSKQAQGKHKSKHKLRQYQASTNCVNIPQAPQLLNISPTKLVSQTTLLSPHSHTHQGGCGGATNDITNDMSNDNQYDDISNQYHNEQ